MFVIQAISDNMLVAEFEIPYLESDTANQYIRGMKELSSYISGPGRLGTYEINENGNITPEMIEDPDYSNNHFAVKLSLISKHYTEDPYSAETKIFSTKKMNCDKKKIYPDFLPYHITTHMNQKGFAYLLKNAIKKGITDEKNEYFDTKLKMDVKNCEYTFENLCITSIQENQSILFAPEDSKLHVSLYSEPEAIGSDSTIIFSALEFAELNDLDVTYYSDEVEEAFDEHFPTTFRYGTYKAIEKTKEYIFSTIDKVTDWFRG